MRFFSRLKIQLKNRNGFTLIETLVALAITGVVAAAVTTTIYQLQSVSNSHYAHIMAVTQVENGVQYMNRDVQSAQIITPHGNFGFLGSDGGLVLSWVSWDTNDNNTVTYKLEPDPNLPPYSPPTDILTRQFQLNQNTPIKSTVARFIVNQPICNTYVAVAASPGDSVLKVASTSAFPPVGALVLPGEPLPITYSGKTSSSFTGIPISGSGSLTLAHAIGQSVTTRSSYCSYDSADHKLILQLTSDVAQGGKQQEETRQLVIIPRPGS
jgi:prepilin-type N-terminal cleavage/methylation domain-containing protein